MIELRSAVSLDILHFVTFLGCDPVTIFLPYYTSWLHLVALFCMFWVFELNGLVHVSRYMLVVVAALCICLFKMATFKASVPVFLSVLAERLPTMPVSAMDRIHTTNQACESVTDS